MDRIMKITIGLLCLVLGLTIGHAVYTGYVMDAYTSSLTSASSYTLSISTDSAISDATFFIPVPADTRGNSMAVTQWSAGQVSGVPASWQTNLFDTGKATLLKISIPRLDPPAGTTAENPFTVTMTADLPSETVIDTADPVAGSPMFRTLQDFRKTGCTGQGTGTRGSPDCAAFVTSVYADYTADPGAAVTITSSYSAKNRWTVFAPQSNEYMTTISLLMHGENHGWQTAKGTITSRIGSYDYPFHYP